MKRWVFAARRRALRASDFFKQASCVFAVWPSSELAKDANVAFSPNLPGFSGVALAWNCRSVAEVDAVLERALRLGATVPKPAQETSWGGYAGYFADPDGHLWEVAHNPGFPLTEDGRLTLPD